MDGMQKLREGLQHALVRAQRATEEGIKHQFSEIGNELIKLGREMKKLGAGKPTRAVRRMVAKKPPAMHA